VHSNPLIAFFVSALPFIELDRSGRSLMPLTFANLWREGGARLRQLQKLARAKLKRD
jgi:hypothetical protein